MVYKPLATTVIGILLVEHRLIERVIEVMKEKLEVIVKENKVKSEFINVAIDFIRIYADKSHHGKEENIFFRDLYTKKLTPQHKEYIDMLIQEHKMGRDTVKKLDDANRRYANGEIDVLSEIKESIRWLIDFYPQHIKKEDEQFFSLYKQYFNEKEQDNMLIECLEFDGSGVHEKYDNIVNQLQNMK